MPRSYSDRTLKQLFLTSGHYCAYPECSSAIVEFNDGEPVILGQIAHIEASSNDGPRANPSLTRAARDHYDNLIILCAHHHGLVDKLDSEYPVETLRKWKSDVVRFTTDQLSRGATQVSFAELKMVCNAFADGDTIATSTPMVAATPHDKMDENNLTNEVGPMMLIGLSQAPSIADYIRKQSQLTPKFPERLRAGFVKEYDRLVEEGMDGDGLFFALINFAADGAATPQMDKSYAFTIHAAAIGVLCHLFEVCDVFKAPS